MPKTTTTTTTLNEFPENRPDNDQQVTIILPGFPGGDMEMDPEPPPLDYSDFSDHFDFLCHFAAGGVGRIGKARDRVLNRIVAVKSLKETYCRDPELVSSFLRECRLNARLDHPAIVPIYALGRDRDGIWNAAMKFINGTSLKEFLNTARQNYDRRKRVKPHREHRALIARLEYFVRICEVIEYIHSLNIVHGDLKPDNILMGRFGELYVMDWGCARPEGSRPKRLSGTPDYLPPEFLSRKIVSKQNDIHALGMILFELVTLLHGQGRPVDAAATFDEPGGAGCPGGKAGGGRHYLPYLKIDRRLKAIVRKAVHPDAGQRYQKVGELLADVRHFLYHEEVGAAPDGVFRKSGRFLLRHRILATAVGILLVVLPILGWTYTAYRAARTDRERHEQTVSRLRLQLYTDIVYSMVATNLLHEQTRLLLFADNLLEHMEFPLPPVSPEYDNAAYRSAATAPKGMEPTPRYLRPVNCATMVRLGPPPSDTPGVAAGEFIRICRKILQYEPGERSVNPRSSNAQRLLTDDNSIQRLIAVWRNGTIFSYPGGYEDPDSATYRKRFFPPEARAVMEWSNPYVGLTGTPRLLARYPLFDPEHRFLGEARLEFRLEKILKPLLEAKAEDPTHEFYFITADGTVLTADDRRIILAETGGDSHGISTATVRNVVKILEANNMEQTVMTAGGHCYYVSGRKAKLLDATLVQMVEAKTVEQHRHETGNP